MLVVYFSSVTGNTARFVEKLGLPAARIPLRKLEGDLVVDKPYVLVCPTYGGGASLVKGVNSRPVPPQVIRFLNNEHNRNLLRGVIAAGTSNFGPDFCLAGDVISAKTGKPYLYRFELMGTAELGLEPLTAAEEEVLEQRKAQPANENAERLARLRARYQAV